MVPDRDRLETFISSIYKSAAALSQLITITVAITNWAHIITSIVPGLRLNTARSLLVGILTRGRVSAV